jgi:hypothetical protein
MIPATGDGKGDLLGMRCKSSAARPIRFGLAAIALGALASGAAADSSRGPSCAGVDYNAMVLDIIKRMPAGGGYSLKADSVELPTVTAHNIGGGHWEMRVYAGQPSHCTGATYTVYAHLVAVLHNGGALQLSPAELRAMSVLKTMPDGTGRTDGQGPFAIFNSNGAGAAALLKHTGTGFSFRDDTLSYARPGDFLKLFWNEGVGSSEQGHQTVFIGRREIAGRDMVCFWSSQRQNTKKRSGHREALYFAASETGKVVDGYGEVCRPRSDIKAMVFSRVTCMEHLSAGLEEMAAKTAVKGATPDLFVDEYLYQIRESPSDHATLDKRYDIRPAPSAFADSGIAPLP